MRWCSPNSVASDGWEQTFCEILTDRAKSGLHLGGHICQHPLDALEVCDPLAKLLPLECVAPRVVERPGGDAQGLGADTRPRAVQHLERDLEALALLAHQVLRRDLHVVEVQLGGVRAADPELVLDGCRAE